MRFARRRRVEVDGLPAPGRGDEYHLYQSLIGIWPVAEEGAEHDLTKRMCQYMDKAGHEAKQRTSWINPNEPYDRAMQNFVSGVLDPRRDNRFLVDLRKWQRAAGHARPGQCVGRIDAEIHLARLSRHLSGAGMLGLSPGRSR